jgi:hypothetical protein
MDRRHSARINLRLECTLQRSGGDIFSGVSRNLSRDGMEMECARFRRPGRHPLQAGDMGVITLSYRKGQNMAALKISARVVYLMGAVAGLHLFVSELIQAQREDFFKILGSGSAKID